MTSVVAARGLTRILQGAQPVTLVEDIALEIGESEFVAIIGPSGSGKSSLLYLLGLLDEPTSGEVLIDGHTTQGLSSDELARIRLESIGFVFQFHFLLPELTLTENVMLPMRKLGRLAESEMRARAAQLLAELDLAEHAAKRPDQLSGGQRQRVAIARALANAPRMILADEPTGNLDSKNGQRVFDIFRDLSEKNGHAVITVTHDPHLAAQCRRQLHLVDGRLESDSAPARA
ncbi:MAG: ABC transporter ATP-binding protein [Burkholderiales bacterium]